MYRFIIAIMLLQSLALQAEETRLRAGPLATTTIELFTSEGCSSCPPADAWLSSLKTSPKLFDEFIPLVFHVDYWNQLGWRDRFSSRAFSERQRDYRDSGLAAQVYTPGFMLNSREWRGWFLGRRQLQRNQQKVGLLSAVLPVDGRRIAVTFDSLITNPQGLEVTVAFIGMDVCTDVERGENAGRRLCHDFVVMQRRVGKMRRGGDNGEQWTAKLKMPEKTDMGQGRTALAVWVSPEASPKIIQSAATYF